MIQNLPFQIYFYFLLSVSVSVNILLEKLFAWILKEAEIAWKQLRTIKLHK